jgi:hypothetical protein
MSTERKPQAPRDEARQEKQTMDQPQEEFVGGKGQPSKDISEVRGAEKPKADFAPNPPGAKDR